MPVLEALLFFSVCWKLCLWKNICRDRILQASRSAFSYEHLSTLHVKASQTLCGVPLNEIQQFECTTSVFCVQIKKLNSERLADSEDELYNVASNAAY